MSTKTIHLADLHFEHKVWSNELAFMKQEIAFFEERLGKIASRYTDKEVLAGIASFQNKFYRHKNVIQRMEIEIRNHEQELQKSAQDHPVVEKDLDQIWHSLLAIAPGVLYAELKSDYFRFMSKWM
jgi:chromosome segregation ATPase